MAAKHEKEKKPKEFWGKIWYFLWDDDSIWSWIVNIILAFVLIKFMIYPLLGLFLGTTYPIVAVVSGSMEHSGDFTAWWGSSAVCTTGICKQGDWYGENEITKEDFLKYPFTNGFNTGDIMILKGKDPKNINVGDIIVYKSKYRSDPIIHRVVKKWYQDGKMHFTTKGDHNQALHLGIGEQDITQDQLLGKAWFRIPYLGWIKIGFSKMTGNVIQ